MSEYEIAKDIANLQRQIDELRALISTPRYHEAHCGRRVIEEIDGKLALRGFVGDPTGLNADGHYIWETSVTPTVLEGEPEGLCDNPLSRASYGGGVGKGICHLQMDHPVSDGACTGSLISKRCVLTAAHCLYSEGRYVASVNVSPGRYRQSSQSVDPFGTHKASLVRVLDEYRRNESDEYDIGLVVLDSDACFDRTAFYWGVEVSDWRPGFRGRYVFGYPGHGDGIDVGHMYNSYGDVELVNANQIRYRMSSIKGMSGGPILYTGGEFSSIHAVHHGGTCPNVATRINETNIRNIHQWIDMYG